MPEQCTFYKAAVITRSNKESRFEVKTLPLPELGPTDVLVKLSISGVCGTDFALASGELGPTCSILGHEGVGRVVKLGSALVETNIRLGQRVGVTWIRDICGECSMCLHDGGETRCAEQVHSGRKVNGTFAEYTVVPQRYLLKIPEDLTDEEVAPILCGGVTSYKALKTCGAVPGQWIAISGAGGGVGALGVMYAKAMGFRVIAIDAGVAKRQCCLELGAELYFDVVKEQNLLASVKKVADGKGAAAVLVAAGNIAAYQSAMGLLGPFGTLVCVGIPPPPQTFGISPIVMIDNGFRIIGSAVGTRGDILEAIDFVRRKVVRPAVMTARLEDLNGIAGLTKSGKVLGKYVITLGDDRKDSDQARV
ncbi:alcohol dehydrogenase [Glonium stellatum]|uniref:alcohol dehydrogenase n=1 Tax=Glonium stellatum TaxID=574774 RepID=A0A8E2FCF7_9PEZI|nr:alcohol dehydrogenase [Glonium stellatum]